jgi:hypothetical protein
MVNSGSFRAMGVSLAALLLVLVSAASVSAASSCSVTVSPKSGAAGTVFTFNGQGFKPTNLMLHKDNKDAGQHSLSEAKDPWSVTVRSRPGDEGTWSAQFSSSACTAAAAFEVTLSNTDVLPVSAAPAGSGNVPIGLAALVLLSGLGGGVALSKRLRTVPIDNRTL